MTTVRRLMQAKVVTVAPEASVHAAAALMDSHHVGLLPVCTGGRATGVLTDRDIVVRFLSRCGPRDDCRVAEIMSGPVLSCRPDDPVDKAAAIMGDHQVRRLVVLDDGGAPVGILSLGDIARDLSEELAGETLGEVVEFR